MRQLDQAWADLKGLFEFHETWLQFLARKYDIDLDGRRIEPSTTTDREPAGRSPQFIIPLEVDFDQIQSMFADASVEATFGCSPTLPARSLAASADEDVSRPNCSRFMASLRTESKLDHRSAICAMIARVLVSPGFFIDPNVRPRRIDTNKFARRTRSRSGKLASRLSFLIWSSVPDDELQQAAAAGKLATDEQLRQQVRRMLRDSRSRRFATEFFGQWFGFYRFHQFRGIDESLFPEFSKSRQQAMYDEAVSFFDFVVRGNRPVGEILFADYAFLNADRRALRNRRHTDGGDELQRVTNADSFHRGGLLKLGAVLATTSAPRRTSPVKRGDWILRRVLGATVPPPPADAGSIAADEVVDDGKSIRQRLIAHRRDVSCHNCHARFDAFGFALRTSTRSVGGGLSIAIDNPVEVSENFATVARFPASTGCTITRGTNCHAFTRRWQRGCSVTRWAVRKRSAIGR